MTDIADQAWLSDPDVVRVMTALEAAGGPDVARFVGGCVRNALIGRPIDDIDIATRLHPEATMEALKAAGLRAVPTGLAHGTVTAVTGGRGFEITTLRRDVTTDGRNATVAFTDDWAEDAARRDFCLNALYADRAGQVFDPTGEGVADALSGRIVFVGEPERRIQEDYLRILRFFRFFAWYGRGWPDACGVAACAALAEGMVRLSAERVSKELLKLLAAAEPVAAVRSMSAVGVLARILPEAGDLAAFERMAAATPDPVLRLSALLPVDAAAVETAGRRLRLPNAVRERLVAAAGEPVSLAIGEARARETLYRLGVAAFRDRVMRSWATTGARADDVRRLTALATAWTPPALPVGGRDLERLGVPPGPETGRLLRLFESDWIAAGFPDDGHEDRLRALIARNG